VKPNAAALMSLLLLAGCSAKPPETVRAAVDKEIALARVEAGVSVPLVPAPGMITPVTVSRDGRTDWLVDYGKGSFAGWCGSGGCRQQLWVTPVAGPPVLAMDMTLVTRPTLRRVGEATFMDISLHGVFCNGYGVDECLRSFIWDPANNRFEERPNLKGFSRIQDSVLQLVEPDQASAPAPVRAAIKSDVAACRALGGSINVDEIPAALSIPDLNGDGVRDWILDAKYDGCTKDNAYLNRPRPTLIFVSGPNGFIQALAAPDFHYEIDVATRPATLISLTPKECSRLEAQKCDEQPLVWDAANRTLH
jgi:hypothetical protein